MKAVGVNEHATIIFNTSSPSEMLDWLLEDFGLDHVAAGHVMAMFVRYVANVFNPAYSDASRILKSALPKGVKTARGVSRAIAHEQASGASPTKIMNTDMPA